MLCVFGVLACFGLVILGFAVLIGAVDRREAMKRVGIFLALLLVAPTLVMVFLRDVVAPALSATWTAAKPVLTVTGIVLIVLLIAWMVLMVVEFVKRRSGKQRNANSSGQE